MMHLFQTLAVFLLKLLLELYSFAIVFRLLLQFFGANYFNPVCQALIKITDPVAKPLQYVLPRIKALDTSLLVMLFVVQYLKIIVIYLLYGALPHFLLAFFWTIFLTIIVFINFYFYAIILHILLSWLVIVRSSKFEQQPLAQALFIVVAPVLKMVRGKLTFSRIDFSPFITLIALEVLSIMLSVILTGLGASRLII